MSDASPGSTTAPPLAETRITDGLVVEAGNEAWLTIPIGASSANISSLDLTAPAVIRVQHSVLEEVEHPNQLLQSYPEQGGPPTILAAFVFPFDLSTNVIVWSCPVQLMSDGNNAYVVDGRLMYVKRDYPARLDTHDAGTLSVPDRLVGAYVSNSINAPATEFKTNSGQTVSVRLTRTYRMVRALQPSGKHHAVWGACYCLRGTVSPFPLFPYGRGLTVHANDSVCILSPPSGYYIGFVAPDAPLILRGQTGRLRIVGAGSSGTVLVPFVNDTFHHLAPGSPVMFASYNDPFPCGAGGGNQNSLVVVRDESLAPPAVMMVDDVIAKSRVRVLSAKTGYTQFTAYAPAFVPSVSYTTFSIPLDFNQTGPSVELVPHVRGRYRLEYPSERQDAPVEVPLNVEYGCYRLLSSPYNIPIDAMPLSFAGYKLLTSSTTALGSAFAPAGSYRLASSTSQTSFDLSFNTGKYILQSEPTHIQINIPASGGVSIQTTEITLCNGSTLRIVTDASGGGFDGSQINVQVFKYRLEKASGNDFLVSMQPKYTTQTSYWLELHKDPIFLMCPEAYYTSESSGGEKIIKNIPVHEFPGCEIPVLSQSFAYKLEYDQNTKHFVTGSPSMAPAPSNYAQHGIDAFMHGSATIMTYRLIFVTDEIINEMYENGIDIPFDDYADEVVEMVGMPIGGYDNDSQKPPVTYAFGVASVPTPPSLYFDYFTIEDFVDPETQTIDFNEFQFVAPVTVLSELVPIRRTSSPGDDVPTLRIPMPIISLRPTTEDDLIAIPQELSYVERIEADPLLAPAFVLLDIGPPGGCDKPAQLFAGVNLEEMYPYDHPPETIAVMGPLPASGMLPTGSDTCACVYNPESFSPYTGSYDVQFCSPGSTINPDCVCSVPIRRPQLVHCLYGQRYLVSDHGP